MKTKNNIRNKNAETKKESEAKANSKGNSKTTSKTKKTTETYQIAVIGAGASGIMAAICAARNGMRVVLIEQKDKIGKKIPATGNGKCNYTNEHMALDCFRGNTDMVSHALSVFSKEDTLSFFQSIGIFPKCKNGYYYPLSEQASSLLFALELELERLKIAIKTECCLKEILPAYHDFDILVNNSKIKADKVIFATGLLASPKLGSDGSSFDLIKELGHHFTPIVPALCGFEATGCNFKKISGVRTQGTVSIFIDDQYITHDKGELQLTDYGISGIPVFQVSRFASFALKSKKKVIAKLDLLPDLSEAELITELTNRKNQFSGNRDVFQMFNGLLNQKLITEILELCHIKAATDCGCLLENDIKAFVKQIKELTITLTRPRGYEFAQICAGGIRSEEIHSQTLESLILPGIYFCGELLDVDGICGGYNLQWAWSSGYLAAQSACDALKPKGHK